MHDYGMYPYPFMMPAAASHQPVFGGYPVEGDYAASFYHMPHGDYRVPLKDYGPNPFVVNINEATKQNKAFRTALWTGKHLQLTLMSLKPGEDIGLERHNNLDQFLRVEKGQGVVQMGKKKNNLDFRRNIYDDSAIFIPAGTWHNLTNTGNTSLKLYSIYAPPNHPFGTIHQTKAAAEAAEQSHGHRSIYAGYPYGWGY
ncbi:cupin domain-containing protein [Bacillus infantis]|uniref:cupin domain-containing protein n=1 Tax=Bacillus infantis TaxID=324767 RepID=UPI001CD65C6B|nr:cupin domain-containing protein [Bacillus infantis]MCA1040102.1 cupin domain-containing protein [Bacillus infantis]